MPCFNRYLKSSESKVLTNLTPLSYYQLDNRGSLSCFIVIPFWNQGIAWDWIRPPILLMSLNRPLRQCYKYFRSLHTWLFSSSLPFFLFPSLVFHLSLCLSFLPDLCLRAPVALINYPIDIYYAPGMMLDDTKMNTCICPWWTYTLAREISINGDKYSE